MQWSGARLGKSSGRERGSRARQLAAVLYAAALATPLAATASVKLDLARLSTVVQSGDLTATNSPARALDGDAGTFSATAETPNAFWESELGRRYALTRIEIVVPGSALYRNAANGLQLRIQDLRDRTVFQTPITDPGPGLTWSVDLPPGVTGRILQIGLETGQPNGAGKYQVALAEVRAFGDPSITSGPINLTATANAQQSSDAAPTSLATKAIDGDPATYAQTSDATNSYWLLTLERPQPIQRIEVINRRDSAAARMAGLILRVLDDQSNTVASATLANPGLGGTWGFDPPAGTKGRYLRIGLDEGSVNGAGDRIVSLAEVTVLAATNVALRRESYMVRYQDSLPPAANANDGDYATEIRTTEASVDAYWEVDLGRPYALYGVRAVAGQGFTARLSHATVRLFDANHDSVFAQHLTGSNPTFDVDSLGPVTARFVRVGFENKERSHISGGIEWYLGLREVQAFGRPAEDVGLLSFSAHPHRIARDESSTLTWQAEELHRLDLYPGRHSVGAFTDLTGRGTLAVTPTNSVEYLLVGTNRNGPQLRAFTVIVDNQPLPVQLSELVADNRLSLEDGRNQASDWIELHNPNDDAVDLAGYGLTDNPAGARRWVFPSVTVPPHGYLIVFASGRNDPWDEAGGLHADFQLDDRGESLVLTDPDGARVDAVIGFPRQRPDLAYGRTVEGRWAFLEPSPGRANLAASYEGWLEPPSFSHARGFFTNTFALTLTQPNEGAELLYSLDGREPATRYVAPLNVSSSVSVRATARRAGHKPPRTVTHSYVLVQGVMGASYMNQSMVRDPRYADRIRQGLVDLPTVMVAVPQIPDDYQEREASVEVFLPDGSPPVQANCGFFRFGGAWTTFSKKNYRLKFRGEYGTPKLRAPLFRGFDRGFLANDAFDEIDLGGGSHDMVERGFYMAGRYTEDTMLDMGSLNPHGRFVNVYLNGKYWGQYHARERLTDSFLADYLGGRKEDYVNVRGNDNVGDSFIPGTPDPPQRATWETLRANRSSYLAVKPYLDVPHLIDFMLMWSYGNCETEYRAAGPIAPGSGFKFWIGDADGFLRTSALTLDSTGNSGPGSLFGALAAERHPDFLMLLADRIQRHFFLDGALTPARNLARLNERMLEITNSLVAECARWGFRTPENWESAAQSIRTDLFPGRTTNLVNLWRSRGLYPSVKAPQLNQWGGTVTNGFTLEFTGTGGTIYYTLDGTDPRLPGGGLAPGALVASTGGEATFVEAGSAWRYWDKGPPPSSLWNSRSFDDQTWATGNAELGYGDGGEATPLDFGPNAASKYPTYYFRRSFPVPDPGSVSELAVELVRDDGAIVYLNGKELFRDNMPSGIVGYADYATTAVGGADESLFHNLVLPATGLVAGANVLAVEVHQSAGGSSDLSFNLALHGRSSTPATGIVLRDSTRIRARARSGSTWSALVEAQFELAAVQSLEPGQVVISEIHYNPEGSDDYEFIELWNVGTNLVDLGNARLAGAVDFMFPAGFRLAPGAFALVVENAAAFTARYQSPDSPFHVPGLALAVAGEWSGRLADEGERLELRTPELAEVCAVDYGPSGTWPQRANGKGSSLELRDPASLPRDPPSQKHYLAQGRHWRSSSLYHGSPGRQDDDARPVVISESWAGGDESTDWIELHNPGTQQVDLFGHSLTDQYDQPFRYRFDEDASIPPGGYLVLPATQLGFGFRTGGSDIVLLKAAGTNIVRFIDTVDFASVARQETCGRYERSEGGVDYTELRNATPGTPNALPRVGPVVFTEIMYRPAPGQAEYVELVNLSSQTIELSDPANPTNAWLLAGALQFPFPPGQRLPPCTPLIVCGTNAAAFRAQYGLGEDIEVLGPWEGALNNAGESLRLLRPGAPEPDDALPHYRVDRVVYEPSPPWPVVSDDGGSSLERVTLEGYGNDPANWSLSAVGGTPGRLPPNRPPTIQISGSNVIGAGDSARLLVQARDPDWPWQTVSVGALKAPPGSTFDSATGRFVWPTDPRLALGQYEVELVATDSSACPGTSRLTYAITVRPPLVIQSVLVPGETLPRFLFEGSPSLSYELQYTDGLAPADWRPLEQIGPGAGGWIEFRDPELPLPHPRFYRVLSE